MTLNTVVTTMMMMNQATETTTATETKTVCNWCGNEYDENSMMTQAANGCYYCETCIDNYFTACDECGEYYRTVDMTETMDGQYHFCANCIDDDDDVCTTCVECIGYYRTDDMTESANCDFYCNTCRDQLLTQCDECGKWVLDDDTTDVSGTTYCEDCLEEHTSVCEHCNDRIHNDYSYWHNDETYCEDCIDEVYPQCDHCGNRYPINDGYETADYHHICNDCYCDHYTTCDDCGEVFPYDDVLNTNDGAYCENCYIANEHSDTIREYGNSPDLVFHHRSSDDDRVFMGVELEIDKGGQDNDNARRIESHFADDHVYFNSDGSLNNGFEIISHPFTYDYYRNEGLIDMYKDAMNAAKAMNYRSHDTTTCGLHVHVGRTALGTTQEERDATLGKLWFLTKKFWPELVKFSRRTLGNLNQWAAPLDVDNADVDRDTAETIGKKVTEKGKANRYHAINVTNSATIEFRIFRGTLNHDTFTATIELVHGLVTFARSASMDACKAITFTDFINTVSNRNNYQQLTNYVNKRVYNIIPTAEEVM